MLLTELKVDENFCLDFDEKPTAGEIQWYEGI